MAIFGGHSDTRESATRTRGAGGSSRLLVTSFAAVLAYWLIESAVDAVMSNEGSFSEHLFTIEPHEVTMRLLASAIIVTFGVFAHRNLRKQRYLQDELAASNLQLEEGVARRTVELASANERLGDDLEQRRILEHELERHRHHLEELLRQRTGELGQTNKRLERELAERRQAEEAVREGERQLHEAMSLAGVGSWQIDLGEQSFRMSPSLREMYCSDTERITLDEAFQLIHPDDQERVRQALDKAAGGEFEAMEYRLCRPSGETLTVFAPGAYLVRDSEGEPSKLIGITQDITERKVAEREAQIAGQINEAKHAALREKNIALKNVVQQVDAEKDKIKSEIRANVERVVMPTLRLLKRKADAPTSEYIDLLKSNLEDVTSPFVSRLESNYTRLSPGEIEICDHIRKGMSSKDIACLRDVSVQTISMQRKRIRKKLGIANQGTSLPALLQSMTR